MADNLRFLKKKGHGIHHLASFVGDIPLQIHKVYMIDIIQYTKICLVQCNSIIFGKNPNAMTHIH